MIRNNQHWPAHYINKHSNRKPLACTDLTGNHSLVRSAALLSFEKTTTSIIRTRFHRHNSRSPASAKCNNIMPAMIDGPDRWFFFNNCVTRKQYIISFRIHYVDNHPSHICICNARQLGTASSIMASFIVRNVRTTLIISARRPSSQEVINDMH